MGTHLRSQMQFDHEQALQKNSSYPITESLLIIKLCHKLAGREYLGGVLYSQDAEINEVFSFKWLLSFTPLPAGRLLHSGERNWNQYRSTGAQGFTAHIELEDN